MAQPPIRAIPFWEHIYYTPFFKSAQVFLVLRGYTRDEMSVGIGSFFNFVKLCAAPPDLYTLIKYLDVIVSGLLTLRLNQYQYY